MLYKLIAQAIASFSESEAKVKQPLRCIIKVHYMVIEILAVRWLGMQLMQIFKRKLAGWSPWNDDEVSIIEYCTGGFVRSENEARILSTPLKRGFILPSKGGHLEKIRRRATRVDSELLSVSLVALRAAQHGLYTSNFLPTPRHRGKGGVVYTQHGLADAKT